MSLKRNIAANYASQIYVTLVGIVMVPLYIRHMGAEAYGLVGFFAMLQAWFNLLDMGLTPTMARESARFHAGAMGVLEYRRLARALEGVFWAVALLGGGLLFALSGVVAAKWLNASHLPAADVQMALQLMAIIIALRWTGGLYRGVITGAEKLVWLSGFNSTIATLRFVAVLPVLVWVSATPQTFFSFQLGVAVLELAGLCAMAYRLLPAIPQGQRIQWQWAPLKPVLKFSLSIAFTSSVWVLVTQTDKLLLSSILPLADYGYFTVAVLVAGGIMVVSGPISSALMPRMTRLHAQGEQAQLIALYRQATQLVTVLAMPVALVLIFFAPQVLWAWTGNAALVHHAAPVLRLYAIGYAFLVVGAFPYYLQYAMGNLRLHLWGNAFLLVLLIPSVVWAAQHYGMVGAGWAWLLANAAYFVIWVPVVHRRFAPGVHLGWVGRDILRPALAAALGAALVWMYLDWAAVRLTLVFELLAVGAALLILSAALAEKLHLIQRIKNRAR
jgi:O-antigen/teichoic acid export membrane protein